MPFPCGHMGETKRKPLHIHKSPFPSGQGLKLVSNSVGLKGANCNVHQILVFESHYPACFSCFTCSSASLQVLQKPAHHSFTQMRCVEAEKHLKHVG